MQKWILSKANSLVKEVTDNMEKYELGIAVQKIYDFIWDEFCDWYIEMVKPRLYNEKMQKAECSTLDIKDSLNRSIETVTSIYAIYHRRDLL